MIVLHTHRYHPPKFQPNLKHHDGVLIFTHFARAACLLLLNAAAAAATKRGRSTLDTKKGYKTKTGSTSSVTLTLTLPLTLALALTPEGGQGEVTGAYAPPPTTPTCPTWTVPPTDPPDPPPPHRPSLNPPPPSNAPLPKGPSAHFYWGGSRVQKRGDAPP